MTAPRPKYRRKQYLMNPRLQFTITALVLGSSLFLALILSQFLYHEILSTNEAYAAQYPELKEALELEAVQARNSLMLYGVAAALFFSFPLILLSILFTHRFTGPIYKATMFFRRVENDPSVLFSSETPLTFRKNDYFKELADAVNAAAKALEAREPTQKNEAG